MKIGWHTLDEERTRIGEATKQRTPQLLADDLRAAVRLHADLQTLSGQVDHVRQQREALLLLLERPQVGAAPIWLEQARRLHASTEGYAVENWTAHLGVSRLQDDALGLYRRRQQLVPARADQVLPAAELEDLVEQIEVLVILIDRLQQRIEEITSALDALHRAERAGRLLLGPALQAIEPLIEALRRVRPPRVPGLARYQTELERSHQAGKSLLVEFDQRSHGSVAEKARRVERWKETCLDTLQACGRTFAAEVEGGRAKLQSEIDKLLALARFDSECAVSAATKLLKAQGPVSVLWKGQIYDRRFRDIVALAAEVRWLVEERDRLLTALDGLQREVVERLRRPRDAWESARQEASQKHEQMVEFKKSAEATWPAPVCELDQAEKLLRQAEREDDRLALAGHTVTDVLDILSESVARYRQAIKAMEELERQASRERRLLEEQVDKIEGWCRQLKTCRRAHGGDKAAVQALDERVDEIERALDRLRWQWQRAAVPSDEARRTLETTYSTFHTDVRLRGSDQIIRVRDIESA